MTETGDVLTRRDFLRVSLTAGIGIAISILLPACTEETATGSPTLVATETVPVIPDTPQPTETAPAPLLTVSPNLFVTIDTAGKIMLTCHRSEMGQGVRTALPMILAEELGADWSSIQVVQARSNRAYGDQVTGGSTSISSSYYRLRQAGAVARQLLVNAAAHTWKVDSAACAVKQGEVIHPDGSTRLGFGDLVETAISLEVPGNNEVTLKNPSEFQIIGQRIKRVDGPDLVTGRAIYGLDVRVQDMLFATIARSPVLDVDIETYDASAAEAVDGVMKVIKMNGGGGLAVVAKNTWAAIQARDLLQITWSRGGKNTLLSSDSIHAEIVTTMDEAIGTLEPSNGTVFEATYDSPYVAHATMEPMNATVNRQSDSMDVWAPTQDPQNRMTNKGTYNIPLIGCGLGRRLAVDYVNEAEWLSKQMGSPVKVVWTREDDIRHDLYRPLSRHFLRAELNANKLPTSWIHLVASQDPSPAPSGAGTNPYSVSWQIKTLIFPLMPVKTGYWRAVWNNQMAFARESFVDELAINAGQDPYEFRRALMVDERMRAVLEKAAGEARWNDPLPNGWGRGISVHSTWGATPCAIVVEVSVDETGRVRVRRVVAAIDCGVVVNPMIVEQQVESGIAVAISAALFGEITLKDGRVEQGNFHDFPIMRHGEMPEVIVHILTSDRGPSGVGEMAGPPSVPALLNAIYDATGVRVRSLPVSSIDLKGTG